MQICQSFQSHQSVQIFVGESWKYEKTDSFKKWLTPKLERITYFKPLTTLYSIVYTLLVSRSEYQNHKPFQRKVFLAHTWLVEADTTISGHFLRNMGEFWYFFFCQIFQNCSVFSHFCSCAFLWIFANLEFIPINFITYVQSTSSPILKSLVYWGS